jgi:hypothetical protein
MQREKFQYLIGRAAEVCARRELVVFGSQAVHAITESPPMEVLVSEECDIWLRDEPEISACLAREMGKDSAFAKSAGVYADPVPPDLPFVPSGWEERLVTMTVDDVMVRCLEIHDLIVSKLSAGRLKDYEFIAAVLMAKLAQLYEVQRRILTFPDPHTQAVLLARLRICTEATDVRL